MVAPPRGDHWPRAGPFSGRPKELVYAARVHDVGKIFIPDRILNKAGPLTEDEYYLVKMHSRVGAEIVATIPNGESLQAAVAHHHEAMDGSGYTSGLRGEEIPLWARIICLADAYVNMTTDRSIRSGQEPGSSSCGIGKNQRNPV